MHHFRTIYADPPWMERGGGKCKRGADRHYPLMPTMDIINIKSLIADLAEDNCHLYLWVTNNFLPDGLRVMSAWGFDYKTMITWIKPHFGLGQYFRGNTEHCLFGVKGNLPYKISDIGKRMQGTTSIHADRGAHSEKPEAMRKMIEKVSYPPYIELFARKKVEGWNYEDSIYPLAGFNAPTNQGLLPKNRRVLKLFRGACAGRIP